MNDYNNLYGEQTIVNDVNEAITKVNNLVEYCAEVSKTMENKYLMQEISSESMKQLSKQSAELTKLIILVVEKRSGLYKLIEQEEWETLQQAHSDFVAKVQEMKELVDKMKHDLETVNSNQ